MKKRLKLKGSRGISPVIAEVILASAVLVVGFSVWGYSKGFMSITANDYISDVQNQMYVLMERFTIEQIAYNNSTKTLRVWVNNYGRNDVVFDLYASNGGLSWSKLGNSVASKSIVAVDIPLNIASESELAVEAVSMRGNNARTTYLMP